MDTFDVPPPPPVPGFELHNEKPLPAVPIEPKRTPTTTSTITTTSSLTLTPPALSPRPVSDKQQDDLVIDFEPLTLKDITLILDRNDRMAAYGN
jgi:hypothetical protein